MAAYSVLLCRLWSTDDSARRAEATELAGSDDLAESPRVVSPALSEFTTLANCSIEYLQSIRTSRHPGDKVRRPNYASEYSRMVCNSFCQFRCRMKTPSPNGVALCTGIVTLLAFVALNLDGYQIHLASWDQTLQEWQGPGDFNGEPPMNNWVHGWPFAFVVRLSIVQPMPSVRTLAEIPWTSRWPIDDAQSVAFNGWLVGADSAIALVVTVLTYLGVCSVARRFDLRFRYSISTLAVTIAFIAIVLAFRQPLIASRYPMQICAAAVVGAASVFATGVLLLPLLRLFSHPIKKAGRG